VSPVTRHFKAVSGPSWTTCTVSKYSIGASTSHRRICRKRNQFLPRDLKDDVQDRSSLQDKPSATQPLSAASRHRLQPSPRHIHPPARARRQLFKRPQRRVQIVRRTSRTPIHHLQVHAPLRSNIRIVPRRSQHLVAQRIVIAVPALTGRRARGVEDYVRDGDDVVAITARLSACAEARAVVRQVAGEGLGVGGQREVLVVSALVVRLGVKRRSRAY